QKDDRRPLGGKSRFPAVQRNESATTNSLLQQIPSTQNLARPKIVHRWTRPRLEISVKNWTRLLHPKASRSNPPVLLDLEIGTGGLGQEARSPPAGGNRA